MEDRLPPPRAVPVSTTLLPAADQRLGRLEERIPRAQCLREIQLEKLHEHVVGLFINSPGFGVARMFNPSESGLAQACRREPVPSQPGTRFTSMWSPGDFKPLPDDNEAPLGQMLADSILDFVNPRDFGYFKDRRHVAGFETHRFSQVPTSENRWKVQTLELVSLLLHDDPEVYVSSHLPRMNRLHDVPTRPLDRFESLALNELRQGDDLFTTQGKEGVSPMPGAVRSTKQCVSCHGGERAAPGGVSYDCEPMSRESARRVESVQDRSMESPFCSPSAA